MRHHRIVVWCEGIINSSQIIGVAGGVLSCSEAYDKSVYYRRLLIINVLQLEYLMEEYCFFSGALYANNSSLPCGGLYSTDSSGRFSPNQSIDG